MLFSIAKEPVLKTVLPFIFHALFQMLNCIFLFIPFIFQEAKEDLASKWRHRITVPKPFNMSVRDENKPKKKTRAQEELEQKRLEKQVHFREIGLRSRSECEFILFNGKIAQFLSCFSQDWDISVKITKNSKISQLLFLFFLALKGDTIVKKQLLLFRYLATCIIVFKIVILRKKRS